MQDLLNRNSTLAEDLAKTGGDGSARAEPRSGGASERIQVETLRRDLHEATQRIEILKKEKAKIESEASLYRTVAGKMESDLKSLSDAYNSLEQSNFQLDKEVKSLKSSSGGGAAAAAPDLEAIKERAREEAQKESEAELNDLLVCLGQEQSKVEKLSARLMELGEDVDQLLEGIGDEVGVPEDDGEDDEEEE